MVYAVAPKLGVPLPLKGHQVNLVGCEIINGRGKKKKNKFGYTV